MTVIEEYQAFINANQPHIYTAQYSIESFEDRSILLMTDKQFKIIVLGEPKDRVINFKDVKSLQHVEGKLVIEGSKSNIEIHASEYDYNKILRRWEPPVKPAKADEAAK